MTMRRICFWGVCLLLWTGCRHEAVTPVSIRAERPVLFPDYVGVTVPATVAPLHFGWAEGEPELDVTVSGGNGKPLHARGDGWVRFPRKAWTALLEANRGDSLSVVVAVRQPEGWVQYAPFPVYVSEYPIDYGLVYRLIAPGYMLYSRMGIYQRELAGFEQTPLLENTLVLRSCVNCHSFCRNDPDRISLHIRGEHGGTVLSDSGATEVIATGTPETIGSCVYPYWHPSGRYIAYSVNLTRQSFYTVRSGCVEVMDLNSDVVMYDVERNELFSCPQLKSGPVFETFPAFSPDGRWLYFCSALSREPSEYNEVRYDLCRIGFDPETRTFSDRVDTLVVASAAGKSVSFPRPSPDGRYLMYTLFDYGNFSIWHKEADLWLLDLEDGTTRPLDEVNSDDTESYHSWSSNSRWFVFSSRRIDGLYTRLYIASVDEQGRVTKPFLLPQETPRYYDELVYSYNVPEFVTGPVRLDTREIARQVLSDSPKQAGFRAD